LSPGGSGYFTCIQNMKFTGEPICSMRTGERTDRQTDMTKLVVAFRNFENAPNVRNGLFAIFHAALNTHPLQPRTLQRNQLLY